MYLLMLLSSTVTQPPAEAATQAAQTVSGAPPNGGMSMIVFAGYLVFIFGLMWLLIIRPQKKRDKKHAEMVSSIQVGDSVVTNTGFYGKVADITESCFVIEFGTNKSILIPVERSEVAAVKEPNLTSKKSEVSSDSDSNEKK